MVTTEKLILDLQGIARLAGVRRHTVTTWRHRYGKDSDTPFPAPLDRRTTNKARLFDCTQIIEWLEATDRAPHRDLRGDAPFYSILFDEVAENPGTAKALIHYAKNGNWPQGTSLSTQNSLDALIEAAYGLEPLIRALRLRAESHRSESLSPQALSTLGRVIARSSEAMRVPSTQFPLSVTNDMGLAALCHATEFLPQGEYAVYYPNAAAQSDLGRLALAELAAAQDGRAFTEVQVPDGPGFAESIPASTLLVQVDLNAHQEPEQLFNDLENLMLSLDRKGAALVIAPARLLTENTDADATSKRRKFLSQTETSHIAPLRYSARLPRSWQVGGGQLQPAVWVLKHHHDPNFPVAVADHSGLTTSQPELEAFTSDLVTALCTPDLLPRANLHNAEIVEATRAWRSDRVAPGSALQADVDAPRLGDLWAAARAAGLEEADFDFVDATVEPSPSRPYSVVTVPWDKATKRGASQVLSVFRGTRMGTATPSTTGGIGIVGPDEIADPRSWNQRSISIFELAERYPRAEISQPMDVIVCPDQRNNLAVAAVDLEGSHVAQAPAFIVRCKTTRGRSNEPLRRRAVPALVAQAISDSGTSIRKAWQIPLIDAAQVPALTRSLAAIEAERTRLADNLARLQRLERDTLHAAAAHTIAARAPN